MALRRHDLVWLDPGFPHAGLGVTEDHRAELGDWVARRLPLVVGRQNGQPGGLRLGLTLPGIGPRRRVEVRAPHSAVLTHCAPLLLDALLAKAPEAWRTHLSAVAGALRQAGITPRAYGSLVTQTFTGEACLRPDSDIDLLIDCSSRDDALAALSVLQAHGDAPPRLDGELRMSGGWAVAWRELAQTLASGGRLLAKSDGDVQLMSADEFLGTPSILGAAHGNAAHAPAASDART